MLLRKVTSEQLARELSEYPKKMRASVSRAVLESLVLLENHHKTEEINRGGSGHGRAVAGKFTSRTGDLVRSYRHYWKTGDLSGWYGSSSKYSKKVEEGGEIRPKNAKFLTIPIHKDAKYGVGGGKRAGDFKDLFFIQSLKGQPMLVRDKGLKGFEPIFLLRRMVKLDPRPTIERTEKKNRNKIHGKIADAALSPFKGK
jgi:hypothetical protein